MLEYKYQRSEEKGRSWFFSANSHSFRLSWVTRVYGTTVCSKSMFIDSHLIWKTFATHGFVPRSSIGHTACRYASNTTAMIVHDVRYGSQELPRKTALAFQVAPPTHSLITAPRSLQTRPAQEVENSISSISPVLPPSVVFNSPKLSASSLVHRHTAHSRSDSSRLRRSCCSWRSTCARREASSSSRSICGSRETTGFVVRAGAEFLIRKEGHIFRFEPLRELYFLGCGDGGKWRARTGIAICLLDGESRRRWFDSASVGVGAGEVVVRF
jgi:hypothetical protein